MCGGAVVKLIWAKVKPPFLYYRRCCSPDRCVKSPRGERLNISQPYMFELGPVKQTSNLPHRLPHRRAHMGVFFFFGMERSHGSVERFAFKNVPPWCIEQSLA